MSRGVVSAVPPVSPIPPIEGAPTAFFARSPRLDSVPPSLERWDRSAILFSGQGAVFPGMFAEPARTVRPLRERIEEADAVAERIGAPKPSRYIGAEPLAGTELVLARSLALCAVQVGLFEHVRLRLRRPEAVTGFSAGEFPALVCAGVARHADLLEVIAERERKSPPPNEAGWLVAIGGDEATVAAVLTGHRWEIANRNGPGQTVVGIPAAERAGVSATLAASGLRWKLLEDVPQPYHTSPMRGVAEAVRSFVLERGFRFAAPTIPVFSSVTKGWISAAEAASPEAMADLLAGQVVRNVDFVEQVGALHAAGCRSFLEVGPGRVLSNLVPTILGERPHVVLPLERYLPPPAPRAEASSGELRSHPVFALLQRAVARVTGWEIESIRLEDRFQEDLGIDSIKKADIVVTVLEESSRRVAGYDSSAVRDLADVVRLVDSAGADERTPRTGRFSRLLPEWTPLAGAAAGDPATDEIRGLDDFLADGDAVGRLRAGGSLILRAATGGDPAVAALAFAARLRELVGTPLERDVFLAVSIPDGAPAPLSGLGAFLRALRKEEPRLFVTELREDDGGRIASPGSSGWNGGLVRRTAEGASILGWREADEPGAPGLRSGSVVVVVGGAGGIGLELSLRLISRTPGALVLAGRSPEEAPTVRAALDRLRAASAAETALAYRPLDAASPGAVAGLLDELLARHGAVDLVLNAAGIEKSRRLAEQTDTDVRDVVDGKLRPAAEILAACEARGIRSVHFGSLVALFGNPGQAPYALANEALATLVRDSDRRAGRPLATAIDSPPWDGIGMTANPAVLGRLRSAGFALLGGDRAAELLLAELAAPVERALWADPADLPLYRAPLSDHRSHRRVLGDPVDGAYLRHWDLAGEPWLADHVVGGRTLLPASVAAAGALAASRLAGLGAVEELSIDLPLVVGAPAGGPGEAPAPAAVRTELRVGEAGLDLRATAGAPRWRARLVPPRPAAALSPEGRGRALREVYGPRALYHSGVFRLLAGVRIAKEGSLSARLDPLALGGFPPELRIAAFVEAAFQAIGLAGFAAERGSTADRRIAPVSAARIEPGVDSGGSEVRLVASGHREGDAVVGDATVFVGSGAAVTLLGARLAPIEGKP